MIEHVAWPAAFVAFGIVFVFVFRTQIAERIQHLRSISKAGLALDSTVSQKPIARQAEADTTDQKEILLKSFDSPALLQYENALFADLEARHLDSKSDTSKVLVRYLAKTRLLWLCEFIYRLIFGSQIAFLKTLNTSPAGVYESAAQQCYAVATEPNRNLFPEDQAAAYFDFLIKQDLITKQFDRYFITNFGREFLIWLTQSGVSENKPL